MCCNWSNLSIYLWNDRHQKVNTHFQNQTWKNFYFQYLQTLCFAICQKNAQKSFMKTNVCEWDCFNKFYICICIKDILIRNILYKNLNIADDMGSRTKIQQGFYTSGKKGFNNHLKLTASFNKITRIILVLRFKFKVFL